MNVGAAVVALAGLGVGTAALWFAWRLVRAAGGEGEGIDAARRGTGAAQVAEEESGDAPAAPEREPLADAPAVPTALGQIDAVLAFGGICLLLPAFINIAELWHLAAAGLATSLLGFAILLATRRRRRRAPATGNPPAAKAR